MSELVHLEIAGGVATITLDSPDNRNALSRQLLTELESHMGRAMTDDAARVIVLTGTGSVFCSGADLKEKVAPSETGKVAGLAPTLLQMWEGPKPVLGRINGAARAGGLGLVTACDIAVGLESATFGLSEVRLGLIPAIISVVMVPKLGASRMMELSLTGEPFDGRAAVAYGLLNAAVPAEKLDEAVGGYLASLLKGAPNALAGCKQLVRDVGRMPMAEAFAEMSVRTERYFQSDEGREGMIAFAEKRPPRWAAGGGL